MLHISPFVRRLAAWIWLGMMLALTAATHTANRGQVFFGGGIYFVDADCYSRMVRVERVMKRPLQPIDFHDFENHPHGTRPHTTAPMDFAVAFLARILAPFSECPVDLAGAAISPLLALALIGFLWWWGRSLDLPYRNGMLLLVAVSPILVHGFSLGRPDHQSLATLLVGVALAAEWAMWQQPRPHWALLSGGAWGGAIWVTLYEPLILFIIVLLLRFALLRREALTPAWGPAWIAVIVVWSASVGFDGWRVHPLPRESLEYFENWSKTIGELQSTAPWSREIFGWCGWLVLPAPLLLAWQWWRTRDRLALAQLGMLASTYALTAWQMRWGYFLALSFAMSLPWVLKPIPSRVAAWCVFASSLFPIVQDWSRSFYPTPEELAQQVEWRKDYALLRQVAEALISNATTPVLAPWWLCPPLAYWSGQPCVAGSSHQSLPGIVDSARFYLATDATAAVDMLHRRGVTYVVAYEPARVLATSAVLLNTPLRSGTMAEILYKTPHRAPPGLDLVFSNDFYKVYEVRDLTVSLNDGP